ncbi:hypothetical protein SELMODRAFT_429202 [Selaginella moellendorffii]|uniref:Uncharacterized protein n=1 Tax=Selaginella moellendorffii TaxID=88036 RepID=D8T5D4_SELML|nr:hypothetical protein SELMODRAFT_429202 [Selaginella moellendorffii]
MEGVVRAALYPGSRAEWDVYQFLKDLDKELVECAQQDLRDAECFHELQVYIWGCDDWLPEASDPHLFRLVALLYLSSLLKGNAAELRACASSAGVTEEALSALVNFFSSLLQPLPAGALSNDGTMLALDAVEEDWQREHPQHGKLRTIVAKVVRRTYFLSPPRRDADGPSCATSLATLRSRIKEARARGDEADRLEAVECEVTKLYKEGYVPVEVADWENVYRSSLGAVLGYTGVGEIDRTEDLEADGEREPAWRWRHVTNIEFKELLSAVQESKLLLHLVTRRPPHSVFLSHRLAVYFCVTHARLWLERSPTFPFAAFRNISYDCLARDGTIFEAEVEDPNEAEEGEDPDIEAEEVEDPSRAIEAAEEVVLQSPLGYLERVPSFVESMQRKEALSLLYDLHRYPGSAHGLVLAIHRTFWYETKLQVFVKDEALRSKYSNITSFLDFVVEDHRPAPSRAYGLCGYLQDERRERQTKWTAQHLRVCLCDDLLLQLGHPAKLQQETGFPHGKNLPSPPESPKIENRGNISNSKRVNTGMKPDWLEVALWPYVERSKPFGSCKICTNFFCPGTWLYIQNFKLKPKNPKFHCAHRLCIEIDSQLLVLEWPPQLDIVGVTGCSVAVKTCKPSRQTQFSTNIIYIGDTFGEEYNVEILGDMHTFLCGCYLHVVNNWLFHPFQSMGMNYSCCVCKRLNISRNFEDYKDCNNNMNYFKLLCVHSILHTVYGFEYKITMEDCHIN